MSPRLRPKTARSIGLARGGLHKLVRLGERRVAATLALDRDEPSTQALRARIAAWEADALRDAQRRKRRGAYEFAASARRLRLRPSFTAAPPELRLTGDVGTLDPSVAGAGAAVCALFSAAPVVLPAAGLVALEFRLLRLSAL